MIFLVQKPGEKNLFVFTRDDVYKSEDEGKSWQKIITGNGVSELVTSAVIFDSGNESHGKGSASSMGWEMLVGSLKGAFGFSQNRWQSVYVGMEARKIYELISDGKDKVYAATDKGIFYLSVEKTLPSVVLKKDSQGSLKIKAQDGPTIQQVQKWAIDYAQVDPQKIIEWREQLKKRAWFPKFSVGMSQDKNRTTSDNIWGSYTGGGQQFIGTDDKTFYNNLGWDVSLSWDLGDVIWSSDETSIDSRAKLMVELRQDILDQVTRLYFERRRIEILLQSSDETDPMIILEQQMRLEELTALIDAFTGGKFSGEIEKQERLN
jgi:hypothetical protein